MQKMPKLGSYWHTEYTGQQHMTHGHTVLRGYGIHFKCTWKKWLSK